jgi:hypothetical protein
MKRSAHVGKGLAAVVLAGSISATMQAVGQPVEISALSSGGLYADYTIWDCCTLNAFNAGTPISQ